MVDGTPVLDIKPYIPYCDNPHEQARLAEKSTEEVETSHENTEDVQVSEECSKESARASGNNSKERVPGSGERTEKIQEQLGNNIPEHVQLSGDSTDILTEEHKTSLTGENSSATIAPWLCNSTVGHLHVRFTPTAERDIEKFSCDPADSNYRLNSYDSAKSVRTAIQDILQNDPRSAYRRKKCADRLYYFSVDTVHVTCWFDNEQNTVEVVCCKPHTTEVEETN